MQKSELTRERVETIRKGCDNEGSYTIAFHTGRPFTVPVAFSDVRELCDAFLEAERLREALTNREAECSELRRLRSCFQSFDPVAFNRAVRAHAALNKE